MAADSPMRNDHGKTPRAARGARFLCFVTGFYQVECERPEQVYHHPSRPNRNRLYEEANLALASNITAGVCPLDEHSQNVNDDSIASLKAEVNRAIAAGDETAAADAHDALIVAEHCERVAATVRRFAR